MRRALGHYVQRGYGGAGTAVRRFGKTPTTAGALFDALSSLADRAPRAPESPLDPVLLAGRSAQEVMDAVVAAVQPVDGTLDAESSRVAIRNAMSDLLAQFPDADLLNLSLEERAFVIERFTANDVFSRIQLDLGRSIQDKAPDHTTALARLDQVHQYVRETVAAAFRRLRVAGRALSRATVSHVVRDALTETFSVFEAFAE